MAMKPKKPAVSVPQGPHQAPPYQAPMKENDMPSAYHDSTCQCAACKGMYPKPPM